MEIYERIKARRKELNLTADQVADALGVSRATIYRYESAEIKKLPTEVLEPLSKILRCSPAYIMGWIANPLPESDHSRRIDKLTAYEVRLIEAFRNSDEIDQRSVARTLGLEDKKGENGNDQAM